MIIIDDSSKVIEYKNAQAKMLDMVDMVLNGGDSTLWLLQHEDVYTIGGSGDISDVQNFDIPVVATNRGGKVTYHGPGQLIAYFMIDVRKNFGSDVHKLVQYLTEVVMEFFKKYNLDVYEKQGMVGVWVLDKKSGLEKKIAAIGVRIKNGISYHGVSININPDLEKFSGIIPCGITSFGVCSAKSMGVDVSVQLAAMEIAKLAKLKLNC